MGLHAAGEWQPMSVAPKDRPILGFTSDHETYVVVWDRFAKGFATYYPDYMDVAYPCIHELFCWAEIQPPDTDLFMTP